MRSIGQKKILPKEEEEKFLKEFHEISESKSANLLTEEEFEKLKEEFPDTKFPEQELREQEFQEFLPKIIKEEVLTDTSKKKKKRNNKKKSANSQRAEEQDERDNEDKDISATEFQQQKQEITKQKLDQFELSKDLCSDLKNSKITVPFVKYSYDGEDILVLTLPLSQANDLYEVLKLYKNLENLNIPAIITEISHQQLINPMIFSDIKEKHRLETLFGAISEPQLCKLITNSLTSKYLIFIENEKTISSAFPDLKIHIASSKQEEQKIEKRKLFIEDHEFTRAIINSEIAMPIIAHTIENMKKYSSTSSIIYHTTPIIYDGYGYEVLIFLNDIKAEKVVFDLIREYLLSQNKCHSVIFLPNGKDFSFTKALATPVGSDVYLELKEVFHESFKDNNQKGREEFVDLIKNNEFQFVLVKKINIHANSQNVFDDAQKNFLNRLKPKPFNNFFYSDEFVEYLINFRNRLAEIGNAKKCEHDYATYLYEITSGKKRSVHQIGIEFLDAQNHNVNDALIGKEVSENSIIVHDSKTIKSTSSQEQYYDTNIMLKNIFDDLHEHYSHLNSQQISILNEIKKCNNDSNRCALIITDLGKEKDKNRERVINKTRKIGVSCDDPFYRIDYHSILKQYTNFHETHLPAIYSDTKTPNISTTFFQDTSTEDYIHSINIKISITLNQINEMLKKENTYKCPIHFSQMSKKNGIQLSERTPITGIISLTKNESLITTWKELIKCYLTLSKRNCTSIIVDSDGDKYIFSENSNTDNTVSELEQLIKFADGLKITKKENIDQKEPDKNFEKKIISFQNNDFEFFIFSTHKDKNEMRDQNVDSHLPSFSLSTLPYFLHDKRFTNYTALVDRSLHSEKELENNTNKAEETQVHRI